MSPQVGYGKSILNKETYTTTNLLQRLSLLCSFLVTIMGLVIPWSLTLAVVDAFSIFVKPTPRQVAIMSVVTIGDWVCTSIDSFISLQLIT